MAGRTVEATRLAISEMDEIVEAREGFDFASAHAFPREIFEKALLAINNPSLFEFATFRAGVEIRRFVHKGCVVVYEVYPELILISRVFGPGRDWQSEV